MNHLDDEGVAAIVKHLLSEEVGITSLDELPCVEAEWLAPLKLPPIKLAKLIKYFSAAPCSSSGNAGMLRLFPKI